MAGKARTASSFFREGMFHHFPGGGEIKRFAVGIVVTCETKGFDLVLRAIKDEPLFDCFVPVFHDREFCIAASRPMANFAVHALGYEIGSFIEKRPMAAKTFRIFGGIGDAHCLGRHGRGGAAKRGKGFRMQGRFPNLVLAAYIFVFVAEGTFFGADIG